MGKVVSTTRDSTVLSMETPSGNAEVHEMNVDAEPERRPPVYNPNPCYECKDIGHFKRDSPLLKQPLPSIAGKLHHTLDVETPMGKEMLDDFLVRLLRAERRRAKLYAKLYKECQQNAPRHYLQAGFRPNQMQ